jgi:hypothetical protein
MVNDQNQSQQFQGRGANRVRLNRTATLILSDAQQDAPLEITLIDLSCEGAGLISDSWVSLDRSVVLVLESTQESHQAVRATVVNCKPAGEQFRVSIRFDPRDRRAFKRIEDAFFRSDHLDY